MNYDPQIKRPEIRLPLHFSARSNEVAVIADHKGCAELGQHILDIVDFVAAEIGLPRDYRTRPTRTDWSTRGCRSSWKSTPSD